MGDPSGPPLRRRDILDALERHGVEYLLVGGQAGGAYGAERPTYDLDICVKWTRENLDRLGEVLVELDAGLRLEGSEEPMPVPHRDGRFLEPIELSTWRCAAGDLDVLRGLPAPGHREIGYDELATRAVAIELDGRQVLVASLDDVITSKETANRPSDHDALPELRRLRDRGR